MSAYLRRKTQRVGFYLRGAAREVLPRRLFQRRLEKLRQVLAEGAIDEIVRSRVNYYNRIDDPFPIPEAAKTVEEISLDEGSYYYFDMKEYLLPFERGLRLAYTCGDNVKVSTVPEIVKSRPLGPGNDNAALLKIDKLRHYTLFMSQDHRSFREKKPGAVWRGTHNNPLRVALTEKFSDRTDHDIGYTGAPRFECSAKPKEHVTVAEQLEHRYVLSVEGYDVATNLKWVLASNSLCMMPKPRFETWFMEGMLEAGTHYVELRPDFEDLDERISHYDRHPEEAEAIIANAQAFRRQFEDPARETVIAMMVLQKYFERSGQLPPQPFSDALFTR